jgi:hypothetical protein
MPCFTCGARQTDPAKGASAWKRGVAAGEQVLICPQCQGAHDWTSGLDHCAACGSSALVRQLDDVRCRDCGHVVAAPPKVGASEGTPGLADEVAAALDRRFGRAEG